MRTAIEPADGINRFQPVNLPAGIFFRKNLSLSVIRYTKHGNIRLEPRGNSVAALVPEIV